MHLQPAQTTGGVRLYTKRQRDYWCRPAWRAFRRTPTLRRELRGLRACQRLGITVPGVVRYREYDGQAELVLEEVAGVPLDQGLDSASEAERAAILGTVAEVVARLHRGGWSHGALYPHHIIIGPAPTRRVALIDLEKARRSRLRRRSDLARFFRHTPMSPDDAAWFRRRYRQVLRETRLRLD